MVWEAEKLKLVIHHQQMSWTSERKIGYLRGRLAKTATREREVEWERGWKLPANNLVGPHDNSRLRYALGTVVVDSDDVVSSVGEINVDGSHDVVLVAGRRVFWRTWITQENKYESDSSSLRLVRRNRYTWDQSDEICSSCIIIHIDMNAMQPVSAVQLSQTHVLSSFRRHGEIRRVKHVRNPI